LDWREPHGGLFLALGVAFAPLHTGIALGNLIIPAAAGAMLAVWASAKNRELLAGVLLALATGLKPQIGGCVLGRVTVRVASGRGGGRLVAGADKSLPPPA